MSFLRVGDTTPTDPRLLALDDPADPMMGPACRGFFYELAALSAGNFTDYVVPWGFVVKAGGPVADVLLRRCVRARLLTPLDGRGAARRWKLIDDAPELIHIRLKAEVAWERQQKSDTQNERHQVAVYLRDGDSCRYCGVPVQPNDNRSGRGRTIDHVRPGQPARTADELVVCCRSCNGARGREWQDEATRDGFAARWPLRVPPTPLFFVASTVTWLESKGHTVPAGAVIAERAQPRRETASTTTTSGPEATHGATQADAAAPGRSTTAPECQHPATQAGVAASDAGTTGATRPTSHVGAATPPPSAGQHPTSPVGVAAAAVSTRAPECQHPAPAGVAAPESRTDRSPTDRSGTAGPGRAGSGRVGSGGFPLPELSPAHPPSPAPAAPSSPPRRTRRGRRRPRSGDPA